MNAAITVAEMIAALSALPQDAEVIVLYDGFMTIPAGPPWLAAGGHVVIAPDGEEPRLPGDKPVEILENETWQR